MRVEGGEDGSTSESEPKGGFVIAVRTEGQKRRGGKREEKINVSGGESPEMADPRNEKPGGGVKKSKRHSYLGRGAGGHRRFKFNGLAVQERKVLKFWPNLSPELWGF